jgi:hypothetical protein
MADKIVSDKSVDEFGPDPVTEADSDDISSVHINLDDLYQRFIGPIEAKRSVSAPNTLTQSIAKKTNSSAALLIERISKTSQSNLSNALVDPKKAQESRAHTFYRMIGLPVIHSNLGDFYNPGFNPEDSGEVATKNSDVKNNPDPNILKLQTNRENEARKRIQMFQNLPLDSSVFPIAMAFVKPFRVINAKGNFVNFNDLDPQTFTITARQLWISNNYELQGGGAITNFFSSNSHILRPLCVNSVISDTVQPEKNIICVPFLKDKISTRCETNVYCDRPGIEFILRIRLAQRSLDSNLAKNIISKIDPKKPVQGLTSSDLQQLAQALLGEKKIDSSQILSSLKLNSSGLKTGQSLVKMIKALIEILVKSVNTISDSSKNIDWTPICSELGPEDSKHMKFESSVKLKKSSSQIQQRLDQLNTKSIISKMSSISPDLSLGNYALSYFQQTEQLYDSFIQEAEGQKNHYLESAADALRAIEIITGEVSGLGLIDILCIYTALWTIDLDVLISMLDVSSFQRLVSYNPQLINENVQKRMFASGFEPVFPIGKAMQMLEDKVVHLLSYADALYVSVQLGQPKIVDGGSSPEGT